MNGYSAQAMPEVAVKMRIAPSTSRRTTSGTSHHFFSWRQNLRNSLNNDHMLCRQFRVHGSNESTPEGVMDLDGDGKVGWFLAVLTKVLFVLYDQFAADGIPPKSQCSALPVEE
jgi:hypothetical protein